MVMILMDPTYQRGTRDAILFIYHAYIFHPKRPIEKKPHCVFMILINPCGNDCNHSHDLIDIVAIIQTYHYHVSIYNYNTIFLASISLTCLF